MVKRIRLDNGEYLDSETYTALQVVSTIVGVNLLNYVTNGSYSTRVKDSGLTHSGAGAADISGRLGRAKLVEVVSAWRRVTAGRGTGWLREGARWVNNTHAHLILVTAETHPSAVAQYKDYLKGGDGLTGSGVDNGPRDWVNGTPNALIVGENTPEYPDMTKGLNPLDPMGSWDRLVKFWEFITHPNTIKRILFILLGIVLIIIALARLTSINSPINIGAIAKLGKAK